MVERVRWAIAGYGKGGQIYHAPLVASASGLEFVAVVTGNPERAAAAAGRWGVAAVGTLEELVGLGVQGVTVTTPSASHVAVARQALDLGLAVVVDKPMALTAADARALVDHARDRGRPLSVYQNRRWDSDYRTVVDLVRSGRLGRVHRMVSRIDRCRPVRPGWANDAVAHGGGQLFDLGSHIVDQALYLFGPARSVHATLLTVRPGAGSEDDVEIQLEHVGGVRSTVAASLANPAPGPRFLVNGSEAGFSIAGADGQEQRLRDGDTPAAVGEGWGREPESAWGTLFTAETQRPWPSARGAWDDFYPAMAAAVAGTGSVPVDPEDAVRTAQVIDAARVSSAESRLVSLPATGGDAAPTLGA